MEKTAPTPREQQASSRDQTSNAQETPSGDNLAGKIYRLHGRPATKTLRSKGDHWRTVTEGEMVPSPSSCISPSEQTIWWVKHGKCFSKILKKRTALIRGNCSWPLRDCLGENVVEYPQFDDKIALAKKFSDFFVQKIETIQTKLNNMVSTPPLCIANKHIRDVPSIGKFDILSQSYVWKHIETSTKKSCLLDPIPTKLVISCIAVLLPVITKIIKLSLQTGKFAVPWKCALVLPLLKKLGLELSLKNYRPVSNLQYISQLTEEAIFQRMHSHMTINSLYPELQSSYHQHHSTETYGGP